MSDLDCNTPEGQRWIEAQRQTLNVFIDHYPDLECAQTCTQGKAAVDALLSRAGTLVAIAEVKARAMTRETLQREFGTYLITAQKIVDGQQLSRLLQVPYLVVVGLYDAVMWWKVTDGDGVLQVKLTLQETQTQRSVNGGTVFRQNAFIDVATAHVIQTGIRIPERVR